MGKQFTQIHKDKENTRIYTKDLDKYLLDGWELGWYRSEEQLNHWRESFTNTYNNKTDTEKAELKLKNSLGNKKRWAETSDKRKQEIAQAVSNGITKMWNNLSEDEKLLRETHRLETRDNWTDEEYLNYTTKMSESAKEERATRSPEKYKEMSDKIFKTRHVNNTLNTSKPEEDLYLELVDKYNEVKRNYDDDPRYPWHCDFYIPSEDLFIELNNFPTHYTEPFDSNNEEHIKLLEQYKTNPKNWIEEQRVLIWAGTDVNKRETAKKNNLNYITIYGGKEYRW